MIATCHQPNWAPGASVMNKIAASDVCIWADEFQFSHGSFTNRNRAADGSWLTIPVEAGSAGQPINRVRIGNPPKRDWRIHMTRRLRQDWPCQVTERICQEIMRPYRLLVGLNMACLRILCDALEHEALWVFQSHLDGGHSVPVVADNAPALVDASERLAMMVEEVGGDIYLSGPSGRHYLSETPFLERGIEVRYWSHHGPNPSALEMMRNKVVA